MDSSLKLAYRVLSLSLVNLDTKKTAKNKIFGVVMSIIILLQINIMLFIVKEGKTPIGMIKLSLQNVLCHISTAKIFSIYIRKKKMRKLFNFVIKTENTQINDSEISNIVDLYTKHGRNTIISIWIIIIIAFSALNVQLWYKLICGTPVSEIHIYWPKNNEELHKRVVNMLFQQIYTHVTVLYSVAWMTSYVLLLTFFAGQCKVVRMKLRLALDCKDETQQKQNLFNILNHYRHLRDFSAICNSIFSPSAFIHLLVVSIDLAFSFKEAATEENTQDRMSRFWKIVGIISYVSFIYWHGNEVTYQSDLVSYGIYESKWTGRSKTIWKLIAATMMATSFKFQFTAGPFFGLNLETMVAILKTSYSFYTLIVQTN